LQHCNITTVVGIVGGNAGNVTEEQFVQFGAAFQKAFAEANALNTEFCDPLFRVVNNVQVQVVGRQGTEAEAEAATTTTRARRHLQEEEVLFLEPDSDSAALTQRQTQRQTQTLFTTTTITSAPSSSPGPTSTASPSVSPAPSSVPTFYPTIRRASVFSYLLTVFGNCRGCSSDGFNSVLLDPNSGNQVSGRRQLQLQLPQELDEAIDPVSGVVVTERRLQEEEQDTCLCVTEAERRGPRVSLHTILLLHCIALHCYYLSSERKRESWTNLILIRFSPFLLSYRVRM
jgi:hypothetical protein